MTVSIPLSDDCIMLYCEQEPFRLGLQIAFLIKNTEIFLSILPPNSCCVVYVLPMQGSFFPEVNVVSLGRALSCSVLVQDLNKNMNDLRPLVLQ